MAFVNWPWIKFDDWRVEVRDKWIYNPKGACSLPLNLGVLVYICTVHWFSIMLWFYYIFVILTLYLRYTHTYLTNTNMIRWETLKSYIHCMDIHKEICIKFTSSFLCFKLLEYWQKGPTYGSISLKLGTMHKFGGHIWQKFDYLWGLHVSHFFETKITCDLQCTFGLWISLEHWCRPTWMSVDESIRDIRY